MAFFNQAITVLQTLVIALGAGLGIWGVINLLEGYGNDNPGANAQVLPTPAPPNRPILPPLLYGSSKSITLMPV